MAKVSQITRAKIVNDKLSVRQRSLFVVSTALCVLRCHVERSRDIWILPKLAFRSQPDLSTRLCLSRDDKAFLGISF